MSDELPLRQLSLDAPTLRSVATGELPAEGPQTLGQALVEIRTLQHTLDELTRKYHGALSQIGRLRADRDGEAQASEHWPKALELFDYWKTICRHPKSEFTADRFFQILPHLRSEEFGADMCQRAIEGAAYDPFTRRAKNGMEIRYDEWDLVFRNRDKAEGFANRAPRWERTDGRDPFDP